MTMITRRLVVIATKVGFTTTTEYTTNGIDWRVLSTTVTEKFPMIIVGRVAARDDYKIYIRSL